MARKITEEHALKILEQAIAIGYYLAEGGHTRKDAAEEFGISIKIVGYRLNTLKNIKNYKYIDLYSEAIKAIEKANKTRRSLK